VSGRARARALLAPGLVSVLLGCSAEESSDPEPLDRDVVAENSMATSAPQDPMPTVPGEGEPRLYHVLLVNTFDQVAHVFATAGAARVVLDTVPAQDSLRVDIRVRADRVDFEAEDGSGRLLRRETVDLAADSLTRWLIGRPTVSLVTDLGRHYPRTRSSRHVQRR